MGTNYFHRLNVCQCCGRYDEYHIGKHSGGWEFSFQAHGGVDGDDEENWKYSSTHPLGPIRSWAEWYAVLDQGAIYNQYGDHLTRDEFAALVLESRNPGNLNHTDYCKIHHPGVQDFKDDDGWSMSKGDFS